MPEQQTTKPRTVSEIMTRTTHTVTPETSVREIAQLLIEHNITGVPVVKDDKLVGIVTEADLVMQKARLHMPQFISLLDSTLYLEDPTLIETEINKVLGTTAEKVLTADVVTIQDSATIEDLATLFEEEHINPVPVLNGKEELVGVVSRADIVRLLTKPVDQDAPIASGADDVGSGRS